jgi:hypothetical protein
MQRVQGSSGASSPPQTGSALHSPQIPHVPISIGAGFSTLAYNMQHMSPMMQMQMGVGTNVDLGGALRSLRRMNTNHGYFRICSHLTRCSLPVYQVLLRFLSIYSPQQPHGQALRVRYHACRIRHALLSSTDWMSASTTRTKFVSSTKFVTLTITTIFLFVFSSSVVLSLTLYTLLINLPFRM